MVDQLVFPSYGNPIFVANPNDRVRGSGWFSNHPPPARDVTAVATGIGSLKMTWKDYLPTDHWDINEDFNWQVTYTPVTLQGVPEVDLVFQKGRVIASTPALGDGGVRSISYSEPRIADGWVQVTGKNSKASGPSSAPLFLQLAGNTNIIPAVGIITGGIVSIFRNTIPYDAILFNFNYLINTPAIEYAGVHIHVVGYNGATNPQEIGPMARWNGSTGFVDVPYRLPLDSGLGSGTATVSNGSTLVTRVSGTNFSAGWVGRQMLFGIDKQTAYGIGSFSDISNLNLSVAFGGTSGTYSWLVLNNSTFYFVPIGTSGARVGDYTTASAVVI